MSAPRRLGEMFRPVDRFLNAHVWVLPFVLTLGMIAILIGTVEAVNFLRQDQHELTAVQIAQYHDQLEACRRGNQSRVANIANLRTDLRNLEADRRLLRELAPPGHLRSEVISAKTTAIEGKREAINQTILSQRPVAIHPGSPIANCRQAYSIQGR